ncbi:MAG: putative selenium-dependent hydroxylase accessory protein YqeC [Chloroflexi bacterium]|nr:MAG: putative selenium-dependent hydroxylase accessory protein YqeC [Chloroflexota bacterium]MBL1195929.1 putative selenium-dependent hydroxylase accessory protein YqeC [Chloroflexota bacterium]NOH13222.1 putative selenium-dependent hydroxylase accessory protein YqeC [Chloroflexota bacterium]
MKEQATLSLQKAFRLSAASRVAFVGAGGKTTGMFQLAREMAPALVTASTHLAEEQLAFADRHIVVTTPLDLEKLADGSSEGVTLVTGPLGEGGRTHGLDDELLVQLNRIAGETGVPLLIEADGSRWRPLKAPAEHEPPIPDFVDTVVVVVGLSGLGQQLAEGYVHRPKIFAEISGLKQGEDIDAEAISTVLLNPDGGLKSIPVGARRIALLNQADTSTLASTAGRMARNLLNEYDVAVVASLQDPDPASGKVLAVHEKMAGIILAAGGSERLGEPKQLLEWNGQPFIRQVAQTALAMHLDELVVVTGAYAEQVEEAIADLPLRVVNNPSWQEGQSSSVKVGLEALPESVGAAIFLLVDQPQVPVELLQALVAEHRHSLASIVAPMVDGRRGNPVLFDQRTFADFAEIEGDKGGRAIFSKHNVNWIPWLDEAMALDVDTLVDYQRLLNYED